MNTAVNGVVTWSQVVRMMPRGAADMCMVLNKIGQPHNLSLLSPFFLFWGPVLQFLAQKLAKKI